MKKVLLIMLAVVLLLSVCSCKSEDSGDTADDSKPIVSDTVDVEIPDEATDGVSDQFFVSDDEVYEIETPYGPIYYPTKWKDMVVTEVTDYDTGYRIKFFAQLDGKSVPLYTVVFGDYSGDIISSGTLTVNDKYVRVYIVDHSGEGMEAGLTGDHETAYLTMCEDVNVIISNLIYKNGMEID